MNPNPLKDLFYSHFYEKPEPILTLNDINIPAASLWTGMRYWIQFFREHNIEKGTRILLSLPPSIGFLYILLASLWEGYSLFLLPPEKYRSGLGLDLDCTLDIHNLDEPNSIEMEDDLPKKILSQKRKTYLPPSPEIAIFLQTSGTTGLSKWIGLSPENIYSVLKSHLPYLRFDSKVLISTLPWTHAFGLVLDLFAGLFSASHIIRVLSNGKDMDHTIKLLKENKKAFWNTVPLGIERVLSFSNGLEILSYLGGGIVGGAPIYPHLVEPLCQSKLRVGYGQTEASPGISLGEVGNFSSFYLGNPLGCSIRISEEKELEFQGENACTAYFKDGNLQTLHPDRWVKTGDLCERNQSGLFFLGRKDASFKLPNGKMFFTEEWENQILAAHPELNSLALFKKNGKYFLLLENSIHLNYEYWESKLPTMILNQLIIRQCNLPKTPKGSVNRKYLLEITKEDT